MCARFSSGIHEPVSHARPDEGPAVSASLFRRRLDQQTALCSIASSVLMQMFISDCGSKALAPPAETHLELGHLFLFNEK
jgi:hypothetical protein